MAVLEIVKYGDPLLRKVLAPVERVTPDLLHLTEDFFETMQHANGVGLAANQVGLDVAMAVIGYRETVLRMFNPRIVEKRGVQTFLEGCLSIPGVEGEVRRASEVTVAYMDENGQPVERSFTGHLARIVQHEVDHVNGILIVSHLSTAARTLHAKALERLKVESTARKGQRP